VSKTRTPAEPPRTSRSESNPFPAGRLRALSLPPLPSPPRARVGVALLLLPQPNCYPRPPTINNLTPLPPPSSHARPLPFPPSAPFPAAINKSRCSGGAGIAEISVILALLGCLSISTTASLAHLLFSFSSWLQLGVCFGWAGGSDRSLLE